MLSNTVAIVGRPNVGKSTIFNRMIGERVSIVDETAGVTRDRIYGKCQWLTKEFSIMDTGGIQIQDQPFQKEIQTQVDIAIEEADRLTRLFPINIAESIFAESSVTRSTLSAFLFPASDRVRIRILLTVVSAVSADEKNEESSRSTIKQIICAISPASK